MCTPASGWDDVLLECSMILIRHVWQEVGVNGVCIQWLMGYTWVVQIQLYLYLHYSLLQPTNTNSNYSENIFCCPPGCNSMWKWWRVSWALGTCVSQFCVPRCMAWLSKGCSVQGIVIYLGKTRHHTVLISSQYDRLLCWRRLQWAVFESEGIVHTDEIQLKCYTSAPTGRAWGHCSWGPTWQGRSDNYYPNTVSFIFMFLSLIQRRFRLL
jgi:hypothetical protein